MTPGGTYSTIIDEDSLIFVHSQDEADEREDCVPILPNSRQIQFKPKIEVHEILHVESYTQEERDAIWSTTEELSMIQEERLQILQAVQDGRFVEDDRHTTRGLETINETEAREENTYAAIYCVLEEQTLQNEECVDDPETIALLYRYCCLRSHTSKIAHRRALKDHAECLAAYSSLRVVEEGNSFSTNSGSLKTSLKVASPWKDQSPISPKRSREKSSTVGTGCQPVAACFKVNPFLNTAV